MSKQRHHEKPAQAQSAAMPSLAQHVPAILLAAVVALFVATPILPSEAATSEGSHATLGMLWCLLLGLWSAAAAVQWVPPMRLDWTLIASLALVGLTALSAIVLGSSGGGRLALNTLWIWINYGIGAFLLRQLVTTPLQGRAVVAVMVALAICLSAHAYYQYFVSQPSFRRDYRANPEKYLEEAGFSTDKQSVERKHLEDRIDSVEPLATFSLTNSLAGFLAPWLLIALSIRFTIKREFTRAALAWAIAALFLAGCLLLTKSRTAVIAGGCGALLLLLYGRRGSRMGWKVPAMAAGLLVLIGLGVVIAGGLDAQVLSEAPKALLYRFQYWRSTAAMIAEHPLLGVGPGRFQAFFARYKLPEGSETVADPHNFLLEIWATTGTPALLALLAMLAAFVLEVWRRNARADETAAAQTAAPLPRSPNDSVSLIYAGAALGFLLGLFLAFLAGHIVLKYHNGGVAVGLLLLGVPVAISFLVWIEEWVRAGELRLPVLLIGLIVLAVNLLAAGAASFPGVMQTAWILIPLALGLNEPAPQPAFRWNSIVAASVSTLLFIACYFTSYAPVLNSSLPMSDAELIPFQSADQLAGHYANAAAADPWAAQPWERLADTRLSSWLRNGFEQDLVDFRQAADEYARREAPSTPAAQRRAHWYLQVFTRSKKSSDLDEALAAARLAAERYPSSAMTHAELAAVWKLAEDDSAAQMEASEALRLDGLNPHQEFKLKKQHLQHYVWDEELKTVVRSPRPETAEQTMLELRKALRTNP